LESLTLFEALFLGIVQGLTEFLPVSSSGHLVLTQALFDISLPGVLLEVTVHLGTLFSILYIFREDIISLLKSLNSPETVTVIKNVFIGSLPIVVVGLFFQDAIESLFDKPSIVGYCLLFTGLFLLTGRLAKNKSQTIGLRFALIIGFSQAVAILPGISRSGMTIGTCLLLGIAGGEATRFSFFLAIPAILGSVVLTFSSGIQSQIPTEMMINLGASFITAFTVGVIALKLVVRSVKFGKFYMFGIYCLIIGIISLWI
tara:strand:- start:23597 stop:24370 length:774 start_codon:yes stop_codon:yes gene_type:complete